MLSVLKAQTWKNRKTNSAIGASDSDLDAKNDFLNRLGHLAYSKVKTPVEDSRKYKSKFFFTLPSDVAEKNKITVGIENLPEEPFNLEVATRTSKYQSKVASPVKYNMDLVSEFILTEITPLLLGLDGGIEQARAITQQTVGDCDPYPFTLIELLTREAVKLKLAQFVTQYFDMNETEVDKLVSKIMPPKAREVVVPVPMNYERSNSTTERSRSRQTVS